MNKKALILLSTFNGEKYLAAQLDSIIAQYHTNWTLLIRDDGSSDKTVDIIHDYAKKDARVQCLNDNIGNLNIIKSFSRLMEAGLHRDEPYIFFCDQDDLWLPNKIDLTLNELHRIEASSHTDTPILVHTDLKVVDENLKTIYPSYLRYENLKRNPKNPIKTLLINNYITGCTIGMNRALLKLATPVPDDARMHDWWCGLCAAACGHIGFISEPTILYRQHSNNTIGSNGLYGKIKELKELRKSYTGRLARFRKTIIQAAHLLSIMTDHSKNRPLIEQFSQLTNQGILSRYYSVTKLGLRPSGVIRSVMFWLYLVFI